MNEAFANIKIICAFPIITRQKLWWGERGTTERTADQVTTEAGILLNYKYIEMFTLYSLRTRPLKS